MIHIVVLNWNGRADTLACLASLSKVEHPDLTLRVVDNGSIDHSVDHIKQAFPDVEVVENGANLGFAEGNNRGIVEALKSGADFILLLNNDTTVDPGILAALVEAADRFPSAGVFGPKIYYYADSRRIWYAGGYWDPATLSFGEHGAGQIDEGQFDVAGETEWVIGCAMFIRAEVFRKVGLLEPKFFLNNEEIDFCSRVRRAGFQCVYVPGAKVWHKISVSFGGEDSPMKAYFSARNRLLWAQRNAGLGLRLRIHGRVWQSLAQRFLSPLVASRRAPGALRARWWAVRDASADPRNRAYLLGVRDYYLRRFGDCPSRVRELAKAWSLRQAEGSGPAPAPQNH